MGFSTTSAAVLVAASLLISTALIAVTLLNMAVTLSKALTALGGRARLLGDSIVHVKDPLLGQDNVTLTFTLTNNGSLPLWDFEGTDLIVIYTPQGSAEAVSARLAYGRDWAVKSIVVDGGYTYSFNQHQSILGGEAGIIEAKLPSQADRSQPVTIIVSTQYGSRALYRFVPG